jgi:hypothetical protein
MSTTTTGSRSLALTRQHRLRVEASPLTCGRCGQPLLHGQLRPPAAKGGECVTCKEQRPKGCA